MRSEDERDVDSTRDNEWGIMWIERRSICRGWAKRRSSQSRCWYSWIEDLAMEMESSLRGAKISAKRKKVRGDLCMVVIGGRKVGFCSYGSSLRQGCSERLRGIQQSRLECSRRKYGSWCRHLSTNTRAWVSEVSRMFSGEWLGLRECEHLV